MIDKELSLELAKNEADKYVIKKELDLAKKKVIEDLESGLGEEMKHNFKDYNKPIKYKKPLKIKIREFFQRIKKVLGN